MVTRQKISILFLTLIIFGAQSIGYDLYAHSLIYYFNNESITHSYLFDDLKLILPRYLLLSYVYEIFREIGIPSGWIALMLTFVPIISIHSTIAKWDKGLHYLRPILVLLCVLASYFYAGLTLSLLWLVALIVTKRKLFIIGSFFHPVGLIAVLFFIVFTSDKLKKILSLLACYILLFGISYATEDNGIFKSISDENIKLTISLSGIVDLVVFAYLNKETEVTFAMSVIALMYFARRRSIFGIGLAFRILNLINYKLLYVFLTSLIAFNAMARDRDSLILSVATMKIGHVVYITWLDFGERNSDSDHWHTNMSRYD